MSNNRVLWISPAKLKENSNVLENVDDFYCRNAILKAIDIKITPVLGNNLVDYINDLIVAGTLNSPGNSVYKVLVDEYAQQAIIYAAIAELLPETSYKITTKGLLQFDNENSTAATLSQINYMIQRYEDQSEYWLGRLRLYCMEKERLSELPQYTNPDLTNLLNTPPDRRQPWYASIYLRGMPYGYSKDLNAWGYGYGFGVQWQAYQS
jgi:hypothetical protein